MILFLDNMVYNHIVTFITFLCSFPVCSYLPLAKNTYFKNTFIEVVCVHTFEGSNVFRVHVKISRLLLKTQEQAIVPFLSMNFILYHNIWVID